MSSLNIFVLDQEEEQPVRQQQSQGHQGQRFMHGSAPPRGSVFFENTVTTKNMPQPRMALGTSMPDEETAARVCYYSLENGGGVVCTGGNGAPSAEARRS